MRSTRKEPLSLLISIQFHYLFMLIVLSTLGLYYRRIKSYYEFFFFSVTITILLLIFLRKVIIMKRVERK